MNEKIKQLTQQILEDNLPPYTTLAKHGFKDGEHMKLFWAYVKEYDDASSMKATR